jgi:hypothetical protein
MPKSSMMSSGAIATDSMYSLRVPSATVIEKDVGFAIQHAVPLQDHRLSDGLRQMAFAGSSRPRNRAYIPRIRSNCPAAGVSGHRG